MGVPGSAGEHLDVLAVRHVAEHGAGRVVSGVADQLGEVSTAWEFGRVELDVVEVSVFGSAVEVSVLLVGPVAPCSARGSPKPVPVSSAVPLAVLDPGCVSWTCPRAQPGRAARR